MIIEIPGPPIPLQRARVSHNRFYDPQYKVKENMRWYVTREYGVLKPIEEPIFLELTFHMPIPKSWSKKKQAKFLNQPHAVKADLSNLIKFYEDCFLDIIWRDDSLIWKLNAQKIYSLVPKTIINIKDTAHDQVKC